MSVENDIVAGNITLITDTGVTIFQLTSLKWIHRKHGGKHASNQLLLKHGA